MGLTVEQVTELAQKYVSNQPVLILGSGASVPHGLPSMPTLANELRRRVETAVSNPDLPTWNAFSANLASTHDLEQSLHALELTESLLKSVVTETWKAIAFHDLKLMAGIIDGTISLPLTHLLKYLLRTAHASVSVVTTNYDRLVEYATNAAEAVFFTGFIPGTFGRFISAAAPCGFRCPGSQGHVRLWKVHGSLDWFEDSTSQPLAVYGASDIPPACRPLIVTPGVTKYRKTHLDPFRTVMAHADTALERASGYLCIGYGFNDEHIQPKLISRISRNDVPILVITKKLSNAGRHLLLARPPRKFLILEEGDGGTTVYHPARPTGELLSGHELWALQNFLNTVIGGDSGRASA